MDLAERLFATRRGALFVGLGAAVLAAILLLVYVKQYRHNVSATSASTSVLVARNLIQKGTPGAVVGAQHLYELKSVPKDSVSVGAYVTPANLHTGVALQDIYPGQQLVAADFGIPANSLDTMVSGRERALSLPIDTSRTLNGQIAAGDHVDIYYSTGTQVHEILQNINVLVVQGGNLTLQLNSHQVAKLAIATDSGKLWFALRAKVGVPSEAPVTASSSTLVGGQ